MRSALDAMSAAAVWWDAVAWAAGGLLLALVLRLLPPWRGRSWLLTLAIGLVGATAGGVLATALGFGGVASLDLRAVTTAALAALLALLLYALAGTRANDGART
jgi:uncharacterized membrane protein YeaQ/YmgE (transglycosylase-associated protein family)